MQKLLNQLAPLEPIATDIQVNDAPLKNIKVVLFDIYGTLMISACGDVGSIDFKGDVAWQALKKAGFTMGNACDELEIGRLALQEFNKTVMSVHQKEKQLGNQYPEIVITEIWQKVVNVLLKQSKIIAPTSDIDFNYIAFLFECLTNPVYPMPNMQYVLDKLAPKFALGIVSNAQFFTPIFMNYFLDDKNYLQHKYIKGFEDKYTSYSYEYKTAKPGTDIFKSIIPALRKDGFTNENILFIGNDMLNDIVPANQVGFKTVLFAGDKRSLRLRKEDKRVKNIVPDRVIINLKQILNILGVQ